MPAREMSLAADLGDHSRAARHVHLLDHPARELGADDAAVTEDLAGRQLAARVQDRQPCRRPAPARGAVDLAVGEHRDVALGEALWSVEEDHAVDTVQLGLVRMDDLELGLERVLQLSAELDQLG